MGRRRMWRRVPDGRAGRGGRVGVVLTEVKRVRQAKDGAIISICAANTLSTTLVSQPVHPHPKFKHTHKSVCSLNGPAPGTNAYATVNVPANNNTTQTTQAPPKTLAAPLALAALDALDRMSGNEAPRKIECVRAPRYAGQREV